MKKRGESHESYLNKVYPLRKKKYDEASVLYVPAGSESGHRDDRGEIAAEGKAPLPPRWTMEGPSSAPRHELTLADLPPLAPLETTTQPEQLMSAPEVPSDGDSTLEQIFSVTPEVIIQELDVVMDDFLFDSSFMQDEEMWLEAVRTPTESEEEDLLADN